jgi:hypothetical protein
LNPHIEAATESDASVQTLTDHTDLNIYLRTDASALAADASA